VFRFDDLERWISPERAAAYLVAVGGDPRRAITLYEWHAELTGALLPVVAHVEVVVRNAIHRELRAYHEALRPSSELRWFDRPCWLPTQRPGWFTQRALDDIAKAQRRVGDRPGTVRTPAGRVVAELSFGFWKFLLSPHYQHSFWSPALRHAFPGAPRASAPAGREQVSRPIDQLHALRNRLAHHEPVLQPVKVQRQPPVFVDVATIIEEAIQVVAWIDIDAATWIASRSRIDAVLDERPR
jgi:hypothetical protein